MKTLLVALYHYNGQGLDSWLDHGSGITYTAAKLAGCNISFLDMKSLRNDQELKTAFKGYDLIAFGLKSSYYPIGMKVVDFAKENGSKVIVGGYHVTAAPQELIENSKIDWVFHQESELTFHKFLKSPESFPREIFGESVQNLNDLPFIDRSIYREPLENCYGWWFGNRLSRMTSVITSRGCPYKCGFCQPLEDNHFGKKLRRRSVDNVIEELKQIKFLYHPECLMIHDDTFLLQQSWIEEFIEKYPQINLPFWAAGRADGICKYPDLVRKLVDVGWDLISVGYESGSQKILDKISKGTTVEQNLEATRIIRSTKARIYANYILGFPWETKEDIQATMRMADEINAEMPSWAFFTPYPGCELGEECIKEGLSLLDRYHYDRCPSGIKVKNVDYNYINKSLSGFREESDRFPVDIIIPTYENEDLTVTCLKSIRECTRFGTYRVIWVDNGSKNISKVETEIKNLRHLTIKLPTNKGFTDAVNSGIEASSAPTICLLNNDTRVSKGWLDKLIKTLYSNKSIGIVGPLTDYGINGVDSPHSLTLHSCLLPDHARSWSLDDKNKALEHSYSGRTGETSFVAFLCACIKREVITRVGHLDPRYYFGMYDDVDYNRMVRQAGYKTLLAIDTCIYHRGRSTFSLIESTEKFNTNALLRKNKSKLDAKWAGQTQTDTAVISRAIYNKLGSSRGLGILTPQRLEIIQENFINSLKSQTDKDFTVLLFVGHENNETTKAIKSLNWYGLEIQFIYTNPDFSGWNPNKGELSDGCPEWMVRRIGHSMYTIMARLDIDDCVVPGWISYMKYLAITTPETHFLINYQPVVKHDREFHDLNIKYSSARTSPFLALVQKSNPRVSPYLDVHSSMGKKFSKVITINDQVIMSINSDNRSNGPRLFKPTNLIVQIRSTRRFKKLNLANDNWQSRIVRANFIRTGR